MKLGLVMFHINLFFEEVILLNTNITHILTDIEGIIFSYIQRYVFIEVKRGYGAR